MAGAKYNFDPQGMRVLIVDDQDHIRKGIRRLLQKMNFLDVQEAPNAQAAISSLSTFHPTLVICDLNLGPTSGFDVLDRIRARNLGADIPVLMVTGEANRDDIVKSVDLGANDYLLKPFQAHDFEKKIVKLLEAFTNPDPLLHKIRVTEKLLLEGESLTALHPLGEAIAMDAKNTRVRYLHAFSLVKTGRANLAEKILEGLLQDQPAYYRACALLADLRLAAGRMAEATKWMERELEYNGKQPERHVQLAKLLLDQGKAAESIEHCRKALLIEPRMPAALMTMGHAQVKAGNVDKGIYYFKRLRRYHPGSKAALEAIVTTCERIHDLRQAEYALRDERAAHPKKIDATVLLARVYFMQDKLEQAVTIAGELINSGAADEANLIMAMAEIKNGRAREALAALEKIQSEFDMAHVCRLRAELYLQLGDPKKAETEALRAFSIEPWGDKPLVMQAEALTRGGEHAKACFALLRAGMLGCPRDVLSVAMEAPLLGVKARREEKPNSGGKPPSRIAS